jgi:hypothetical protein
VAPMCGRDGSSQISNIQLAGSHVFGSWVYSAPSAILLALLLRLGQVRHRLAGWKQAGQGQTHGVVAIHPIDGWLALHSIDP